MLTKIGISTLLAGLFVGIFTGISRFMAAKTIWVDLTLFKLVGEKKTESIITWFDTLWIQESLDTLFYDIPFFGLLISIGVILLVLSLFIKDH